MQGGPTSARDSTCDLAALTSDSRGAGAKPLPGSRGAEPLGGGWAGLLQNVVGEIRSRDRAATSPFAIPPNTAGLISQPDPVPALRGAPRPPHAPAPSHTLPRGSPAPAAARAHRGAPRPCRLRRRLRRTA